MKYRVLVFPCGTEIGLEIYRSLSYSTHFTLIGGSSVDDHGLYEYENYIGDIPYVGSPTFGDHINKIIEDHKIDFVIPAHDSALLKLSQMQAASQLKCPVIASPASTCEITRSKLKTYQLFESILKTPKVYLRVDELTADILPVFLKPDVGQGSKGTYLANSVEDVEFYVNKDQSLLMLEYLPGPEYTIDCFTNKAGQLLFAEGRQRNRISNGISVNSSTVKDKRFKELAEVINKTLDLRGVWFFQVKENIERGLVLMEITSRVAGTMGLVRCKGVNLVLLSLFDALGFDVNIFENDYNLTIDRALSNKYKHEIKYDHVYIDFDDLVVFDGQVNPKVMAFVYQCVNKKITTHLITKHKGDLHESLHKYHLKDVFNEVIWIEHSKDKLDYITEKDAIFIDDSFAERKNISDNCNIPVFDSHMLESLME